MLTAAVMSASIALAGPPTIDDCWHYYYGCIDSAYNQYLQDNDSDKLINAMGNCWHDLEVCFFVSHNDFLPYGVPMNRKAWEQIREIMYP
jgi:hypothetical protein